jgi:hypothetical protein
MRLTGVSASIEARNIQLSGPFGEPSVASLPSASTPALTAMARASRTSASDLISGSMSSSAPASSRKHAAVSGFIATPRAPNVVRACTPKLQPASTISAASATAAEMPNEEMRQARTSGRVTGADGLSSTRRLHAENVTGRT